MKIGSCWEIRLQYHHCSQSKVGELDQLVRPKVGTKMPVSALSAESMITQTLLKIEETPTGGRLLGVIKPIWTKALESEKRLAWLIDMGDRELVVRDLEIIGCTLNEKLRTESAKEGELEREVILEMMKLKVKDERRNLKELRKIREQIRDYMKRKIGRIKYKRIMEKLGCSLDYKREELKKKYSNKTKHLEKEREEVRKRRLGVVPSGLEKYSKCKIFNREEMEKMKPEEINHELIGKINIDEEERSILDLNPKFAVMRKLKRQEIEQDIELGLAKIRYEVNRRIQKRKTDEQEETDYGYITSRKRARLEEKSTKEEEIENIMEDARTRRIYDPVEKIFDNSKRRVTD